MPHISSQVRLQVPAKTVFLPTRRIHTEDINCHTFPTTQNFTRKHYNFLSQSFQPKTVRQDFHHTTKETSLRFTAQITRKCTVTVFIRHENQHRTQRERAHAHARTHTHTHSTLNEMHRFLFSGSTILFLAAFLRFLFGIE